MIEVLFYDADGHKITIEVEAGTTLMDAAVDNAIPMPALCNGCMSCSTCHVVVHDKWIGIVGTALDDELDMLEMLPTYSQGLSRLSCQISLTEEMHGLEVTVPDIDFS